MIFEVQMRPIITICIAAVFLPLSAWSQPVDLPPPVDISLSLGNATGFGAFAGEPIFYHFVIEGQIPGTQVISARFELSIPPGAHKSDVFPIPTQWTCIESGQSIVCTISSLRDPFSRQIDFAVSTPPIEDGLRFIGTASVTTSADDPDLSNNVVKVVSTIDRKFTITTTADFGPGSFREALQRSNEVCTALIQCKIIFANPDGATLVIEPLTPLPAITTCYLWIEGGFRTKSGATAVMILGSRLAAGNGLEIRTECGRFSGGVIIADITVSGFPENGILLASVDDPDANLHDIRGCQIGTDAFGTAAVPNGLRGVESVSDRVNFRLNGDILSGNRRSGVFIWAAHRVTFIGNLVGPGQNGEPIGNGACGIYVGANDIVIQDSVVAYNGGFGIAVARSAPNTAIDGVSIYSNVLLGIDRGLDGVDREDEHEPNPPTLTDAFYDPATGHTVIRGVLRSSHRGLNSIVFFANRSLQASRREGETGIAGTLLSDVLGEQQFEVSALGDYRGKMITATTTSGIFLDIREVPGSSTSEFSEGIVVR
jgi:hypothetical protein